MSWALTGVVVHRPLPSAAAQEETEIADEPVAPPAPPPTAALLVDALPWGQVVRIVAADGSDYALPDQTTTPLELELPIGFWEIFVRHPEQLDEPQSCQVILLPDDHDSCVVELAPLTMDAYFREVGWWR